MTPIADAQGNPHSSPSPQLKTACRRHPEPCQQPRITQGPVHAAVCRDIAEHVAGDNFQAMTGKARELSATGFQAAMDGIAQPQTEAAELMAEETRVERRIVGDERGLRGKPEERWPHLLRQGLAAQHGGADTMHPLRCPVDVAIDSDQGRKFRFDLSIPDGNSADLDDPITVGG